MLWLRDNDLPRPQNEFMAVSVSDIPDVEPPMSDTLS